MSGTLGAAAATIPPLTRKGVALPPEMYDIVSGQPRLLSRDVSTVGTPAALTLTALKTFALPAGFLDTNGRGLRVTARGLFAANANTKTLSLLIGATSLFSASSTFNNVPHELVVELYRLTATTALLETRWIPNAAPVLTQNAAVSVTWANAQTFTLNGQNGTAAANDIQNMLFQVDYIG